MSLAELPKNRAVYVCKHVFENTRDVDYISYMRDGDICMTCIGMDHDPQNPDDYHVVGLGHLIERDPTLLEAPGLSLGDYAERPRRGAGWAVFRA